MAPAIEVTTVTAYNGTTTMSTIANIWPSSYNTSNVSTTTTTTSYPPYGYGYDPTPDYVYFYSGYAFYIVLFFLFVILLPFVVIMSSMQRKRQENARRLALQRQRARQQMEISVANNSTANTSTNCDNGVCIQTDNDMTILPKGMDLPPSYDELNISSNVKEEGNIGASTLTITTDLECSNPNLAAAFNEPPPEYDQGILNSAPPQTTTISTTTVVSVTPRI